MRVVTNEDLIKKKASMVRNVLTAGFILMAMAAGMAFFQSYIAYAYVCLLVSLPMVSWSARGANRWLQSPRPDQVLAKALKGLDRSYQLYSYTLPIEHALLCPKGLFALHVKTTRGSITCRGGRWRRKFELSHLWGWLTDEGLGNPGKQAQAAARKLSEFVAAQLPEAQVSVQPLVVFVDPAVKLEVSEPTVPAMLVGNLKAHLRDVTISLAPSTLKDLGKLLDEKSN